MALKSSIQPISTENPPSIQSMICLNDLIIVGYGNGVICSYDSTNKKQWEIKSNKEKTSVSKLYSIKENIFVNGKDDGRIELFDIRKYDKPFYEVKEAIDYISDLCVTEDKNSLYYTSGDGTLSLINLKRNKHEFRIDLDDELLSLTIVKNDTKLLLGTQEGNIEIFNIGEWEDTFNRFTGHPDCVDTMLKIDEDTILTGSSDGMMRVISILPNKFLGVLGGHDDFPIHTMKWSGNRQFIASASVDCVRLWNSKILTEDDDDEDGDEDAEQHENNEKEKDSDSESENENKSKKTKCIFYYLFNFIANKRKQPMDQKIQSKKPYGGFFDDL